jgi:hypothetical protein
MLLKSFITALVACGVSAIPDLVERAADGVEVTVLTFTTTVCAVTSSAVTRSAGTTRSVVASVPSAIASSALPASSASKSQSSAASASSSASFTVVSSATAVPEGSVPTFLPAAHWDHDLNDLDNLLLGSSDLLYYTESGVPGNCSTKSHTS